MVNKYFNTILKYIIIVSIFTIYSCKKKGNLQWDTDIVAPLLVTTLDIGNFLGDSNVVENPDQSLSLTINQKINLLTSDLLVDVNDTLSVDVLNLPYNLTVPPGQKIIEKETTTDVDFGDLELTSAEASVARMKFYVTNTVKHKLLVNYKLYSATKDGVIYEINQEVPAANNNGNAYIETSIDLDNYILDLTGPNKNAVNTIYSKTTVWVSPDSGSAIITPQDSIIIISTFEKFKPKYAQGYLGSYTFLSNTTTPISFIKSFKSGTLDLQSANAEVDIYNNIGADLSFEINNFSTEKNNPAIVETLQDPIIGSIINCTRATKTNVESNPVSPTHYHYDIVNSNLDNLIEIMPDSLLLNVSATINPLGNVSFGNDFIYFDHNLEGNFKINIPLNFNPQNLVIEQESPFSFTDQKIKSGKFNIYIDNTFPFDLDIQMYLLDDQGNIIDSLFTPACFAQQGILNNGIVIQPRSTIAIVNLTPTLLSNLFRSKNMLIRSKINSPQNVKYNLYKQNCLKFKIVGDFAYEI